MAKDTRYLIYRSYTPEERADPLERKVFYGWTHSKFAVSAFLMQRSKKKYVIKKMDMDMVRRLFSEDPSEYTMLNYVELKSVSLGCKVTIFATPNELNEAEKKLQYLFHSMCSLESAGDDMFEVLRLFMNLDEYYSSALHFLGYRPPEVDAMFPSADEADDISSIRAIEEDIDDGYSGDVLPGMSPVGPAVTEDLSKKMIYSLEGFIKVLKDDM